MSILGEYSLQSFYSICLCLNLKIIIYQTQFFDSIMNLFRCCDAVCSVIRVVPSLDFVQYSLSSMASPNLSSAGSGTASASGSVGSGATRTTDIKAPLWDHVTILERPKAGGGNASWRCNYCGLEKCTSYTRVEAHLLQKSGKGIGKCPKVTYEMLSQMRMDVERCQELVERAKQRTVSLPVAPSVNNSKKKRGPASILEKSWALEDRKHLDALIVRAMYSGGISFNFLRNPYFREAFAFACSRHNLQGYTIRGYNRARESLLKQERSHIETLLESTKSTWPEKGVTICSDG